LSIVPQINQLGAKVKLIDDAVLTGKDLFTMQELSSQIKSKGTDLIEDAKLEGRFNVVQE